MANVPLYSAKERRGKKEEPKLKYHPQNEDDEEVAETGEPKKLDNEYISLVRGILTKVDEQSRAGFAQVLQSDRAIRTYRAASETGMPPRAIRKLMTDSIQEIAEDRDVSPAAYVAAFAEELQGYKGHEKATRAMYEDKLLSEKQYEELSNKLKSHTKKRMKDVASDLENLARAAVWIFLIAGVVLMISSGIAVTGGVIGKTATPTLGFIIGFVLFVLGLLMKKK